MGKPLKRTQHSPADRLLIVMPTWLGDTVMATPTLRAFRELYPQAHITALIRRHLRPIIDGCPWIDRIVTARQKTKHAVVPKRTGPIKLAARLASGKFDTAVLLPNSFRSALLVRMAGIRRRVGYDRDGRGGMLTDRLLPRRMRGKYVPVPTRDYYLGLARYLGAIDPDPAMRLFTRPDDDRRADGLLRTAGVQLEADPVTGKSPRPLVILNPGANFGEAKIWFPQRFAQVADRCAEHLNAIVAVSGAPNERPILDEIRKAARHPIIDLPSLGVDLTLLKSVIRRANLMITNDTGPRHIAAAFNVPLVTIFGPTDPAWSETDFPSERQVFVDVYCRPCQKKKCPLRGTADDHVCMKKIDAEMVFEHAVSALREAPVRVAV
jgi:heptosyltransferase-2